MPHPTIAADQSVDKTEGPKLSAISVVKKQALEFFRSMRSGAGTPPAQAAEWAKLEEQFEEQAAEKE